jgi:hypothetical protein
MRGVVGQPAMRPIAATVTPVLGEQVRAGKVASRTALPYRRLTIASPPPSTATPAARSRRTRTLRSANRQAMHPPAAPKARPRQEESSRNAYRRIGGKPRGHVAQVPGRRRTLYRRRDDAPAEALRRGGTGSAQGPGIPPRAASWRRAPGRLWSRIPTCRSGRCSDSRNKNLGQRR